MDQGLGRWQLRSIWDKSCLFTYLGRLWGLHSSEALTQSQNNKPWFPDCSKQHPGNSAQSLFHLQSAGNEVFAEYQDRRPGPGQSHLVFSWPHTGSRAVERLAATSPACWLTPKLFHHVLSQVSSQASWGGTKELEEGTLFMFGSFCAERKLAPDWVKAVLPGRPWEALNQGLKELAPRHRSSSQTHQANVC